MHFFAWNGDILAKIVPNAEWVVVVGYSSRGPKEEHLKVRTAKRLSIGLKEPYFPGHLNIHAKNSSQIQEILRHLLHWKIAKQPQRSEGALLSKPVTSKFHNP